MGTAGWTGGERRAHVRRRPAPLVQCPPWSEGRPCSRRYSKVRRIASFTFSIASPDRSRRTVNRSSGILLTHSLRRPAASLPTPQARCPLPSRICDLQFAIFDCPTGPVPKSQIKNQKWLPLSPVLCPPSSAALPRSPFRTNVPYSNSHQVREASGLKSSGAHLRVLPCQRCEYREFLCGLHARLPERSGGQVLCG